MLSSEELARFSKARYSPAFIGRVYQEYQTYGGEMDYRNYLDFVLAMNEMNSQPALAYIFKLMDLNGQGYLDEFIMSYFLRALAPLVPVPLNIHNLVVSPLIQVHHITCITCSMKYLTWQIAKIQTD